MEGVNTVVNIERVATLTGSIDNVWHLAWSPKGNILASCGSDKTIKLWKPEANGTWVCKAVLEGAHQRTIRKVNWSPDARYLTSCSFDATTTIWENQDGDFECIATLEGHENEVKDAKFDKSGSLLATCSRDKTVWIWEMDGDSQFECISVLPGHTQDVKSLVWHPTQEILASTSYDDTIRFWTPAGDDWESTLTLTGHQSTVWDASFDPTGDMLVSASDDKTLIIWKNMSMDMVTDSSKPQKNANRWLNVCRLSGFHKRAIYSVDWGKSGIIVTAGGDNSIKLFSQDQVTSDSVGLTFSCVGSVEKAHTSDVNCVAWHPIDNNVFASCGDDGIINIWRVSR